MTAVVGTAGAVLALTLVDRRARVPHADILIAGGMIVFFVACTAAFVGFLRWRDRNRGLFAARTPTTSHPPLSIHTRVAPAPAPDRAPTVYDLVPGVEYVVLRPFVDYHQQSFETHQRLRFIGRAFLPYHGGHTLFFEGRAMYLQEEQNADIIDGFARFLGYAP